MKKIVLGLVVLFCSLNTVAQNKGVLVPYRVNDKWGYARLINGLESEKVKMALNPAYDEAGFFTHKISAFYTPEDMRAKVKRNGLYGYINLAGEEIIPPMYKEASDFYNGYARVKKGNKSVTIDLNNEIVNDSFYTASDVGSRYISAPFAVATPQTDKTQWPPIATELECDSAFQVDKYSWLLKKGDKWGAMQNGKIWVPVEFDSVQVHGYSFVTYNNGKKGLCIEVFLKPTLLPAEYDDIQVVRERGYITDLYWLKKDGLWGFVNSRGELIEPRYKSITFAGPNSMIFYKVTTTENKTGYVYISGMEFFGEKMPPSSNDLKPYFKEAEEYAGKYIEQQMQQADSKTLIAQMENCMRPMMTQKVDNRQQLYLNFCTGDNINSQQIDTLCISKSADIFAKQGILQEKAPNVSPILIETCKHLSTEFDKLIKLYPDYPFSIIVRSFNNEVVNELSASLMRHATSEAFEDCDFNTGFYPKVVLLYQYYGLVYNFEKETNP